jgi:hypothetical protein
MPTVLEISPSEKPSCRVGALGQRQRKRPTISRARPNLLLKVGGRYKLADDRRNRVGRDATQSAIPFSRRSTFE